MIFYFSGTGNSKYIAKQLLNDGEELISISDANKHQKYEYDAKGERVGFIFPVYFYNVPTFVEGFIKKLTISNCGYGFSVIACGGSIKQAGNKLKMMLAKRTIELKYVRELVMPDNSMLFYQIPDIQKAKKTIKKATDIINKIRADLKREEEMKISDFTAISDILKLAYDKCQNTAKFWVDKDKCLSCGLCASNCPEEVIEMVDGYPKWEKERCCKCSSCINRCPATAINYGKSTIKRNRYVFPEDMA